LVYHKYFLDFWSFTFSWIGKFWDKNLTISCNCSKVHVWSFCKCFNIWHATFLDAITCCTPNDYMKMLVTNKMFVNFIQRSLNLTSPLENHWIFLLRIPSNMYTNLTLPIVAKIHTLSKQNNYTPHNGY
jgi:hypothetical protein